MAWIVDNIQWIMLASGVLTLTMAQAVFAPSRTLTALFGETLEGPLARLIVRNWGFLIVASAGMLIYGAFHAEVRPLVLTFCGAGKLCFVSLVFAGGARYAKRQAFLAAILDTVMVILFAAYLAATLAPAL